MSEGFDLNVKVAREHIDAIDESLVLHLHQNTQLVRSGGGHDESLQKG